VFFTAAALAAACGKTGDDPPAGVRGPGESGGSGGSQTGGKGGVNSGGRGGGGGKAGSSSGGSSSGGTSSGGSGNSGGSSAGEGGDASGGADDGGTSGVGGSAGGGGNGGTAGGGGTSGSSPGVEICGDGADNDGDDDVDCADDDCEEPCSRTCESAGELDDPSATNTSNIDLEAAPPSDCGSDGPALIHEVLAETTGILEVEATGGPRLAVSISAACDDWETLGCGLSSASAPVTAGDTVFVRVAGVDPTDSGYFSLSVFSRPANACGDGYRDLAEACDGGNADPGDGCDDMCEVEATESEDNAALADADAFAEPFFGEVSPAGDQDYVTFDVAAAATIVIETRSIGDEACERGKLDSYLELFDADGDLLDTDDDGGTGNCSRISIATAVPVTYNVRVGASPTGDTPTFPYELVITGLP
jgi:cysteine-rich repeat protein